MDTPFSLAAVLLHVGELVWHGMNLMVCSGTIMLEVSIGAPNILCDS